MAHDPNVRCTYHAFSLMLHLKLRLDIPTIDPICPTCGIPNHQSIAQMFNCTKGKHQTASLNAIRGLVSQHGRGRGRVAMVKSEVKDLIPDRAAKR